MLFFLIVCNIPNADIYFVLDVSGSIGADNFKTMQDFVVSIVNSFPISNSAVRVGVITFSSQSQVKYFNSSSFSSYYIYFHKLNTDLICNRLYPIAQDQSKNNRSSNLKPKHLKIFSIYHSIKC